MQDHFAPARHAGRHFDRWTASPLAALAREVPALRALAWRAGKRAVDVATASLALVALLPLLLAVAAIIRLDSRGPALFRQTRIGRGGRRFTVLKFRTMAHGASPDAHRRYIARLARGAETGPGLKKLTDDARITRVGRVLRRTSIDELPQLLNVLAGHMSVVGPRPALEYELEHYGAAHFRRFDVRPGLTGLWQVTGRNRLGFHEMLDLDAEYAASCGPRLDAVILLRTPAALLRGNGG